MFIKMSALDPENIFKGALIGVASLGTFGIATQQGVAVYYYDKETGRKVHKSTQLKNEFKSTSNLTKKSDEELFFGIANGLAQIFIPKIIEDNTLQRILINPLIPSFATTLYKESKGKNVLAGASLKLYFSAVAAAALVELPLNNLFNRF